jgi:hypothetical protein
MAKHHEISHGFNKQGKALKNPITMCFNPAIDLLVSKQRIKLGPKLRSQKISSLPPPQISCLNPSEWFPMHDEFNIYIYN